jgi:hypothetical protein
MGGRSANDNFKKRFGDPVRIEIRYAKDKMTLSEDSHRSEQLSAAYTGVLKGILGREPTMEEIIGKKDISGILLGVLNRPNK